LNSYPRETKEFLHAPIAVDGATVTTGIEYAVAERNIRPTAWTNAVTLEGKTGVMIDGYTVGDYVLWARITSAPEVPVLSVGMFKVT
jgi:hypothetical protein